MLNQNILFVFSELSDLQSDAFERVIEIFQRNQVKQIQSQLHFLCVKDEIKLPLGIESELPSKKTIENKISSQCKEAFIETFSSQHPSVDYLFTTAFGHLYLESIHYCINNDISLLLKSARNPSWFEYTYDTEDMHLIRKCPIPIWLTKSAMKSPIKCIVVALDFEHVNESEESTGLNQHLLREGIKLAEDENAKLVILNVYDVSYSSFASIFADNPSALEKHALQDEEITRRSLITDALKSIENIDHVDLAKLDIETKLVQGNPKQAIAKTVKALYADILIMGSVGRTGIAGLFIGNTAESTLLQIDCAVMVMKPEGFISPVIEHQD